LEGIRSDLEVEEDEDEEPDGFLEEIEWTGTLSFIG
jgi:hypothetical protein